MKIEIKKFKELLNHCDSDKWTVGFRKWEHMDGTPQFNGYKGWPNVTGLMIVDNFQRVDDITGMLIHVFVLKEDIDENLTRPVNEMRGIFCCQGYPDDDFLEFRLEIEELPGKFTQLDMTPTDYDLSYCEKFEVIHFEEDENTK